MSIQQFIRENRAAIDAYVNNLRGRVPKTAGCYCPRNGTDHRHDPQSALNDEERRQWVLNDETLYRSARAAGCKI